LQPFVRDIDPTEVRLFTRGKVDYSADGLPNFDAATTEPEEEENLFE
jgi:hypothetical protein